MPTTNNYMINIKHIFNKSKHTLKMATKYLLAGNVDADLETPAGAAGLAMLFLPDAELSCTTNVNKQQTLSI